MERARHRKSKSASGLEGVNGLQKHKAVTRLSSDSSSYIDGSTRSDMFTLELGKSSSGQASGRLMTKLMAEEMYKEMKSRRRSPSVIAKLMGLEGLPSLWHVHIPKKKSSDSYQQKDVSTIIQPNRQLYDDRSNRRCLIEQQEFSDVYEDLEASDFGNRRFSSRWSASSMLTKSEMALIQQRFKDAKHLSAHEAIDGKLRDSEELDDTLNMLDSRKDPLMKLPQQPDSFCVNHLHDIRVTPSSSFDSHPAALKPSNSAKYEGNAKAWILERGSTGKRRITSHPKRMDGLLLEQHNFHRAHICRKLSKIQLEEKNEKNLLPTRIVVLRPNIGEMQNAGLFGSSPEYSDGCACNSRKMKEYTSAGGGEEVSWRWKDSSYDVGFSKTVSKEAREIAREITRRMRGGCDETMDAKSCWFRGYAGDQSSYDARESDFDSDPKMFLLPSRNSFKLSRNSLGDGNKWGRYASSSSVELSVNREAKKKLSERWRTTHRYRDLEILGEGSTLGEMLAMPDGETRSKHYANSNLGKASARLGSNSRSAMWDDPLGISSRDGWKNEVHGSSSRSRSLPPSVGGRSHSRGTYRDELAVEKYMMRSDPIRCGRSKVSKSNLSHKESFSSQDSKSRGKKPLHCQHIHVKETDPSSKANFEIQMEANIKDLSEQQLMFQMAAEDDSSGIPASDVMIAEHGSTALSSESSLLHPKQSSSVDDDKAADQEDFCLQELHKGPPEEGSPPLQSPGAQPASSEISRDADHASPVSVLEVPFIEDASTSSESFDRVSVELNDLRMQLQLLKMDSAEVSTPIPIEEDISQLSSMLSDGNYILGADGWEFFYAFDVLIHSGLQESGFDVSGIMWHSPDSPLDPSLFDTLEKKYNDETTGLRPERRLLFDRINTALFEIFQQHVDLYPWVMPKLAGLNSTWQKERVKDAIEKLINEESVYGQKPEKVLDREMQWEDAKEEIDGIGNEVEELLIEDMIAELVSM